ncbi:lipocalin [Pedobacter sp. HMWF019]|uniref:lipocalin family protein n=1 Tax=Pedobacter sp. HMWF019 TaxID=2056856 RepID=UPI000D3808F0|nr:lipocalin family protein [Pedobacter sp. HMWF019]PTS94108.1 lipocalin [Pedobacter sp. HMWF019]
MKTNKVYLSLALGAGALALLSASCKVSIPKGAEAVKPFDKSKYLGKWYEIARLDFKYEKNLNHVTATYTQQEEGLIKVDNRGFDVVKGRWKNSIGKAKPVMDPEEGRLKVSFFGPFYAGYNVIAIDQDYRYALVVGNNLKYMWILSREKTIPETVRLAYLNQAKALGYDINALVWTKQD